MNHQAERSNIYSAQESATPFADVGMDFKTPLLVGIPFYKNEHLVEVVVTSLIDCANELNELGAELILYNDSPDYEPLSDALTRVLPIADAAFPTRTVRNDKNIGFVGTMNQLIAEGVARRFNVLMLNSDTVVFSGVLREMARVAGADPMIGFVSPRSNNATLATFPPRDRPGDLPPSTAHAAWKALAWRLPDVTYAPTAVGFCLLCRWKVLAEFGGFDEIYGDGYNEENDLIMRAGRCGYRAVLANKAFVWHAGEASFSLSDQSKALRETANRAVLLNRYPEYAELTRAYFNTPEHKAEKLLATLLPDEDGRIDIAFDFSSFGAYHNGTFIAGRQLLAAVAAAWRTTFNVFVVCSENAYAFHDYAAFGVERHDPEGSECYAAIFTVGQPYDFSVLERVADRGAVVGFYMLDTISIDCGHLYSPHLYDVWQFALEHADLIVTTSQLTADQLERRFHYGDHVVRVRSMHSLDLEDYRLSAASAEPDTPAKGYDGWSPGEQRRYWLVIGNTFPHKYVVETANALAKAYPDVTIVAVGASRATLSPSGDGPNLGRPGSYPPPSLDDAQNIVAIPTGYFTDAEMERLYARAQAIVFPTHYEGFGFPLLNALAVKRPVFARRVEALEEVWLSQGANPNVHFFDLTTELIERLSHATAWQSTPDAPPPGGGAARSADEIMSGLQTALDNVSYRRIAGRLRGVQFARTVSDARAVRRIEEAERQAASLACRLEETESKLEGLKDQIAALTLQEAESSTPDKGVMAALNERWRQIISASKAGP